MSDDGKRERKDRQHRDPELRKIMRAFGRLPDDETSLGRRIALLITPIVAAIVVGTLVLFASSWRLPPVHPWALYAIVALPYAAQWLMRPLTELCFQTRADQPRQLTAEVWLRQRLESLGHRDVAVLSNTAGQRLLFDRYAAPGRILTVPDEQHHARGAAAYAWAARALSNLLLLQHKRGLGVLSRMTDVAQRLYTHSAALLIGATLVGLPALGQGSRALLAVAATGQLIGVAFHFVTTKAATRLLLDDPRDDHRLAGPAAELAIRQLRRESAAELLRAAAYVVVAFAASSISASSISAAAAISASAAASPILAAPPLHGLDLVLAIAAALLCTAAAVPCIAIWRSSSPRWVIALAIGAIVLFVATPSLVALTWNQSFALAHPWTIALGFAAVWPPLMEIALWVPGIVWHVTLGKLWPEPDRFVAAPVDERSDREPAVDAAKLPGLPAPIAVVGFLFKAAVVALPLPLAYLTLRALF